MHYRPARPDAMAGLRNRPFYPHAAIGEDLGLLMSTGTMLSFVRARHSEAQRRG